MAKERNLQLGIVADASGLKKGLDDSKAAVRDFQRAGSNALDALDNALGGAISKAKSIGSAMRGAAIEMGKLGNAGKAAGSLMSGAMATATTAIAGLGIGAAIASFKVLSAEAENFKTTVRGANIELATAAYVSTYKQVLHDANASLGEGAAKAESAWKKFIGTLGAQIKQTFISGAAFAGELTPTQSAEVVGGLLDTTQKAADAAAQAEQHTNNIYNAQRELAKLQVVIANNDSKIADLRYKANLETYTAAERASFLAEAQQLINDKYDQQIELQKVIVDNQQALSDLATNDLAAEDALINAKVALAQMDRSRNNELRELTEKQRTLNKLVTAERDERERVAALRSLMAANPLPAIATSPLLQPLEYMQPEEPAADLLPAIAANPTLQPLEYIQPDGLEVDLEVHPRVEPSEVQSFIGSLKSEVVNGVSGTPVTIDVATDASNLADARAVILSQLTAPEVGLAVHPQVEPTEMQSFISSLKDGIVTGVNGTTVTIGIAADMSDFIDVSGALNSQLTELGVNTSEIIGGLIGDLATGGDAWSNFSSGAVSAFADLAISVGKMAIQTGVATLGIKAALESLNPYVAIAAGAALVALGSALKTGMSNAASGNYSASTNVASASSYSSGSSIGSDTYGREMTVKVTGRLEATGSTLAAVLDNEAQRYNRTT